MFLTGCFSQNPVLENVKNQPIVYKDLKEKPRFSEIVQIEISKNDPRFKKFLKEFKQLTKAPRISVKQLEKCYPIYEKKLMKLPVVPMYDRTDYSNPLPLIQEYANCLNIPYHVKGKTIDVSNIPYYQNLGMRKKLYLYTFTEYSIDIGNIYYYTLIISLPSKLISGKIYANIGSFVIGVDQTPDKPIIFEGIDYRISSAEDGIDVLENLEKMNLEVTLNLLKKNNVPFKILSSYYAFYIKDDVIHVVDMLFGLTPIESKYSEYNLLTEYKAK
jgi:hypothetical protein